MAVTRQHVESDCVMRIVLVGQTTGVAGPPGTGWTYPEGVATATSVMDLPQGRIEYRMVGAGEGVVLALHGAHLSAASNVGLGDFVQAGRRVLTVSRPGYGRTSIWAGPDRNRFADTVAQLAHQLGIRSFDCVVGMSAGSPTALAFAAHHPGMVRSLVLQSGLSSGPYGVTSLVPSLIPFSPMAEYLTWSTLRSQLAVFTDLTLTNVLASLSTGPGHQVIADLAPGEKAACLAMVREMRSGSGYWLDVTQPVSAADELSVQVPTLVVGSPYDGQVPFAHTQHLARTIPTARLHVSSSRSHLVWFGSGVPAMRQEIHQLLDEAIPSPGRRSRVSSAG